MATTTPSPSIEQLWEQLNASPAPKAFTAEQLRQLQHKSNDSLRQLQRNIRINSAYTIGIGLIWAFLFFYTQDFWVRFCFGFLLFGHLIGLWYNSHLLRKVLPTPPADLHIKTRLQAVLLRLRQALRGVEYVGLFFYPMSITAGFSLALWEADKLHLLSTDRFLQLLLLGTYVVLVPLCFWLTRWLHKIAYGKQLQQLQTLVEGFEEEEA